MSYFILNKNLTIVNLDEKFSSDSMIIKNAQTDTSGNLHNQNDIRCTHSTTTPNVQEQSNNQPHRDPEAMVITSRKYKYIYFFKRWPF